MESGEKIMETYLPIRESVGYENLKEAVAKVFFVNLDELEIQAENYEDFSFKLPNLEKDIFIGITASAKHQQFNFGEGGKVSIMVENPKYPIESMFPEVPFYMLLADENLSREVDHTFGDNEEKIERTLHLLEAYLKD